MGNSIDSERLTSIERELLEMAQKNGYTTGRMSHRNKARILAFRHRPGESFDTIVERMLNVVEWLQMKDDEDHRRKHGFYPQKLYLIQRGVWLRLIERPPDAGEPQP